MINIEIKPKWRIFKHRQGIGGPSKIAISNNGKTIAVLDDIFETYYKKIGYNSVKFDIDYRDFWWGGEKTDEVSITFSLSYNLFVAHYKYENCHYKIIYQEEKFAFSSIENFVCFVKMAEVAVNNMEKSKLYNEAGISLDSYATGKKRMM